MDQSSSSSCRFLWKNHIEGNSSGNNDVNGRTGQEDETYESVLKRFCSKPGSYHSLATLGSNSLVVGQEFALSCLLLARHRCALWQEQQLQQPPPPPTQSQLLQLQQLQQNMDRSQITAMIALVVIALYTNSSASPPQPQPRKAKIQQRSSDAILLAVLLRMVAAVLRTLTASFSSDTVESLSVAGMVVHWLSCDYSYANGNGHVSTSDAIAEEEHETTSNKNNQHSTSTRMDQEMTVAAPPPSQRPTFRGGTVSLNAAFFSTALLASRLSSNATVYVFVASAIIVFAFYPAARHAISCHPQRAYSKFTG